MKEYFDEKVIENPFDPESREAVRNRRKKQWEYFKKHPEKARENARIRMINDNKSFLTSIKEQLDEQKAKNAK